HLLLIGTVVCRSARHPESGIATGTESPTRWRPRRRSCASTMPGIDAAVEMIFGPIATILSAVVFYEAPIFGGVPIIVVWLMAAAIFLTVWLRFQPITGLKHSIQVIRGRYTAKTEIGRASWRGRVTGDLAATAGCGAMATGL